MELIYIGSPAKSEVLGKLIRGKEYDVPQSVGETLLLTKDWEKVELKKTKKRGNKRDEKNIDLKERVESVFEETADGTRY